MGTNTGCKDAHYLEVYLDRITFTPGYFFFFLLSKYQYLFSLHPASAHLIILVQSRYTAVIFLCRSCLVLIRKIKKFDCYRLSYLVLYLTSVTLLQTFNTS